MSCYKCPWWKVDRSKNPKRWNSLPALSTLSFLPSLLSLLSLPSLWLRKKAPLGISRKGVSRPWAGWGFLKYLFFASCLWMGFLSSGCRLVTGKLILWEEMPIGVTDTTKQQEHPHQRQWKRQWKQQPYSYPHPPHHPHPYSYPTFPHPRPHPYSHQRVHPTKEEKLFLPPGNYRAYLNWISEGVVTLTIKGEGHAYPLRLYIPTPRNWKDRHGGFQFFSSQLGQPFDVKGNVRLNEDPLRRFRHVPCTYYRKTFSCQYDPVRCQKRTRASGGLVKGERTDEHLFKRETLEMEVEFFLPGSALPIAEFKGEGKQIRPVKVMRGLCH